MSAFLMMVLTSPVIWVAAVIAYFCGCFNGAVIVSKYILRDDVRNHGSGNAGLTNFYRTFGGPLTLVVILTDVLKAVVAILVAKALFGAFVLSEPVVMTFAKYWGGLFCLLGHMFPCMFGFKGGKGILSGGAVAIMLDWRIALLVWGGFFVLAVLTKYVSLGSILGSTAFAVGFGVFQYGNWIVMGLGIFMGLLAVAMHWQNILRLVKGQEKKMTAKKTEKD